MKRNVVMALVLSVAMILGSFSAVFATTGAPTDKTREEIAKAGVQCTQKIKNEVDAEKIAYNFNAEVSAGKYGLISTEELKNELNDVVIIDTMPQGWFNQRHIPGAICSIVGGDNGPKFEILPQEEKDLLAAATNAVGTKKVTKYYNKKTKKWTTKKIKGAKKKTVTVVNNKKVVVYCGFVGCARSHQGAMFLKQHGFNVYRYAGGISAWVDANNDIEGTDVEPAPAA